MAPIPSSPPGGKTLPSPPRPIQGNPGGKKDMPRVLIVDDNPTNLQIVGNLLSAEVFDIGVALNAEQALEFVEEHPLDLVLLDIVMPGMDGYEVCRRIRKKYGPATLPIIFLTSRSDEESVVRGFEAGGVDYVIKPFRCHELLARSTPTSNSSGPGTPFGCNWKKSTPCAAFCPSVPTAAESGKTMATGRRSIPISSAMPMSGSPMASARNAPESIIRTCSADNSGTCARLFLPKQYIYSLLHNHDNGFTFPQCRKAGPASRKTMTPRHHKRR